MAKQFPEGEHARDVVEGHGDNDCLLKEGQTTGYRLTTDCIRKVSSNCDPLATTLCTRAKRPRRAKLIDPTRCTGTERILHRYKERRPLGNEAKFSCRYRGNGEHGLIGRPEQLSRSSRFISRFIPLSNP